MVLAPTVLLLLIALALAPGWLFYFDITPKVALLLVGAAVALFTPNRAPRWLTALVILNAISLALSAAASTNPALAFTGTNWRQFGVVTQVAVWIFAWGVTGRTVVLLRGISIATTIAGLYGIAQYFGWDPILPAAGYHVGTGVWGIVRPPSTFGYVSYFATWLAMAVFLALAQAAMEESPHWRRFALATAILAGFALLLTGSRAAMLGVTAGAAVWAWRTPRRSMVAVGCLLIAAGAFYFSPAGSQMRSRTRWFIEDPWGGARPVLWLDTLRMAAARPIVGFGPETFTAEFPHYESRKLAAAYPDFAYESPHNILLDALIAQGLPGLGILAVFCFTAFRAACRKETPWIASALAAGFVGQQFTAFTVPTATLFFTIGVLACSCGAACQAARRLPIGTRGDCQSPGRISSRPTFTLLRAVIGLAFVFCAVRLIAADHALALAQRSLDGGSPGGASAHYQEYRRWRFPGASADLWYSRALLNLAPKLSDAAERIEALAYSGAAALEATRTSEDPFNAWYNLAVQDATRNDAAGAERSLRAAIHSHPNWFKPHWTLAQLLRLESRWEDAEDEAALAWELDGGKHPEVSKTLAEIRMSKPLQR